MKLEEFLALDLEEKFGISEMEIGIRLGKLSDLRRENPEEFNKREKEGEGLVRIRDCYEIQKLLKRDDTSLGRHLDEPCSKCGEVEVYCGYEDIGAVGYYDNFWHLCLNCLDAQHRGAHTGLGQGSEGDTNCPFCHYHW